MKKLRILAVLAAFAVMLSGCMGANIDLPSDIASSPSDALTSESSGEVPLPYGAGLEEIKITAEQDPDPDRQIVHKKAPVMQIRGVDAQGNSLSNDFYFYRNLLSGTYKQAYDHIYAALYNGIQTIYMSVSVRPSDIANIVYSVHYDHPELFWVDNSLTYYTNMSGIVTSVTVNFNGTASNLQNSRQVFENAIAPLLNYASSLSDNAQKVKLVHDYRTNTIQYVSGSLYNQSAYSAIVNGKTVCAGYAHASACR